MSEPNAPRSDTSRIELTIPASSEWVRVARLTVAGVASRLPFPVDAVEDIKLAVTEAINNAIQHAPLQTPPGQNPTISVVIETSSVGLWIDIVDGGRLQDELPVASASWSDELPEGGLGLMLIRSLMDEVEHQSGPTSDTVVRMFKRVPTSQRATAASRRPPLPAKIVLTFAVNTHPERPPFGSDFDLKSSASARAREVANFGAETDDSPAIDAPIQEAPDVGEGDAVEDVDLDIEPDLIALDSPENSVIDDLNESSVITEATPLNYLGLNEESESEEDAEESGIETEEEEDEAEFEPLSSQAKPDAKDEDYAEFERIFIEWKATNDPRLRERLILMNRSMVMFLARRFMDRGELFEDVLQVGMLGLIYALDGYELERGVKFSTFAIPTISGEIRRYFRDKVSGMRVPRGLQELHATLQTRIEELTQQLDRSPTYAEIAFSLKIEVEQVVEAMELGAAIDPLSIDDRYFGEESATIAESVGAPDPHLHAYEEHAALQAALEKLPAQERRVLELSFFEGHSQAEIARRMNVSQMHISRLLRRSLSQLKQLLEDS